MRSDCTINTYKNRAEVKAPQYKPHSRSIYKPPYISAVLKHHKKYLHSCMLQLHNKSQQARSPLLPTKHICHPNQPRKQIHPPFVIHKYLTQKLPVTHLFVFLRFAPIHHVTIHYTKQRLVLQLREGYNVREITSSYIRVSSYQGAALLFL